MVKVSRVRLCPTGLGALCDEYSVNPALADIERVFRGTRPES